MNDESAAQLLRKIRGFSTLLEEHLQSLESGRRRAIAVGLFGTLLAGLVVGYMILVITR